MCPLTLDYETDFFPTQCCVCQDYDWHVGNQLDYKEHNVAEFVTPPNLLCSKT